MLIYYSPSFLFTERSCFNNLYGITDITFVLFIMCLKLSHPFYRFLVHRVLKKSGYGNDYRLVHLIADYFTCINFVAFLLLHLRFIALLGL